MVEATAGSVQNQPRAEIPADQSQLLVEIAGCTRRETSARNDELGRRGQVAEFNQALLEFGKRQGGPGSTNRYCRPVLISLIVKLSRVEPSILMRWNGTPLALRRSP